MERMSARFVARKVGMTTEWVYSMWKDMGLVTKDEFDEWILTEEGKNIGGKMSNSNHCPVPTFDFGVIEKLMIDFYNTQDN